MPNAIVYSTMGIASRKISRKKGTRSEYFFWTRSEYALYVVLKPINTNWLLVFFLLKKEEEEEKKKIRTTEEEEDGSFPTSFYIIY